MLVRPVLVRPGDDAGQTVGSWELLCNLPGTRGRRTRLFREDDRVPVV